MFVNLFLSSVVYASINSDLAIAGALDPQFAEANGLRFSLDSCDPLCLFAGKHQPLLRRLTGLGHCQQVDADATIFPRTATVHCDQLRCSFELRCAWIRAMGLCV